MQTQNKPWTHCIYQCSTETFGAEKNSAEIAIKAYFG
jgi:hypothetical protein